MDGGGGESRDMLDESPYYIARSMDGERGGHLIHRTSTRGEMPSPISGTIMGAGFE